jgi:hypothetical protein
MDPIQALRLERDVQERAKLIEVARYEEMAKIRDAQPEGSDARRQAEGELRTIELERISKSEKMSPPGALHLPDLLERRRWEAGITDEAFQQFPIGENVFIYQIPVLEGATFAGTKLFAATGAKEADKFSAGRGIIVAAGLPALDYLWSYGVEPGHIVRITKLSTMRLVLAGHTKGREEYLLVFHCSECRCSTDLGYDVIDGRARVERDAVGKHRLVYQDGRTFDGCVETDGTAELHDGH